MNIPRAAAVLSISALALLPACGPCPERDAESTTSMTQDPPPPHTTTAERIDDTTVLITSVIHSTRADVFDAMNNDQRTVHWYVPDPAMLKSSTIDARKGGEYRNVMDTPNGDFVISGEYLQFAPPEFFQVTEEYNMGDWEPLKTSVRLDDRGNHTLVTVHIVHPSKGVADLNTPNLMSPMVQDHFKRLNDHVAGSSQ